MYRPQVDTLQQLLAEQGKDAYDVAKQQLLALTLCGTFAPRRGKTHLTQHSGIVHGDIDHVADVAALKAALSGDPRTVYTFVSPSGVGVKLGVHVPIVADDPAYKHAWQAVSADYERLYEAAWDVSGKDVCRLCYVSYDPELYTNFDAIGFDVPPMPTPAPRPPTPTLVQSYPYPLDESTRPPRTASPTNRDRYH